MTYIRFTLIIVAVLLSCNTKLYSQVEQNKNKDSLQEIEEDIQLTEHEEINDRFDALLDTGFIEFGINCSSKSIYIGKSYGPKGLLFNPSVTYAHKSGLGVNISSYVWKNIQPSLNITDINIFYSHEITDWWNSELVYTYWIFHKNFPDSLNKNNIIDLNNNFSITNWFGFNSEILYMFGPQKALVLKESITGIFYLYPFHNFQRFAIEPEAGVFIGNETIYTRQTKNNTLSASYFGVLDYFALLKLTYQYKRFTFGLSYQMDSLQGNTNKKKTTTTKLVSYFSFGITKSFGL